jgi:hypothetical protein
MVPIDPLRISATIGRQVFPREKVLQWEAARNRRVFPKLDLGTPSGRIDDQRHRLLERKLEIGRDGLERRLGWELRWSARLARAISILSRGRRRLCTIELVGCEGSAEKVPAFYRSAIENGNDAALLEACPDHYVLSLDRSGMELVLETTGGSPLAARIYLDGGDISSVTTVPDPDYPVQWFAVGRAVEDGPVTGAIRHQFRDEDDGFRAVLTGEFPAAMPSHLIRAHRWHLACEFSNWIEAANSA